jgi:hypothetical protein
MAGGRRVAVGARHRNAEILNSQETRMNPSVGVRKVLLYWALYQGMALAVVRW